MNTQGMPRDPSLPALPQTPVIDETNQPDEPTVDPDTSDQNTTPPDETSDNYDLLSGTDVTEQETSGQIISLDKFTEDEKSSDGISTLTIVLIVTGVILILSLVPALYLIWRKCYRVKKVMKVEQGTIVK